MGKALFIGSALALVAAGAGTGAWAAELQDAPDPDVAARAGATGVAEVVVTANRTAQARDRVGQSVTVLTDAVIRSSQATAAADLLARTPGVSFTRNGGPGASTSLNIRGAESQHTVVLIDGVKLNDPSSTQGGLNAGNLLIGDIARIEVLRGAQSTLWGSQAIGGVVNIVTREPEEVFEASANVEAGARDTAYLRAGVGGRSDRVAWRLAGGYYTTDGFSAYRLGRERDGYINAGASGRLRATLTDAISAEVRAVYSRGRNDFDAVGADTPEFGRTAELVAYAGLNAALLDGRLKNRVAFAYTDTDRENLNPLRAATQPLTFDAAGKNRRFEYQGVFAIREDWTVTFGAESETARMRTRSPTPTAPDPADVRGKVGVDSVYGQMQAGVGRGLTLTGGLRYDDHDTFGGHVVGQVAAAWSLNDGATVLRASWGEGFRAPGVFELYSDFGNTGLSPERVKSWDAGVEQRLFDRARVSATWFDRDADNEIRFNSCTAASTDPLCRVNGTVRFGYYRNILKTRARGVELSGEVTPLEGLTVSGNYTWTDAENASGVNAGKRLVRRPEHMWNLSAAYEWPVGVSTAAALRHVGKTFNNDANTVALKAYTVVDVRASWPVTERVEIFGRIENLLDEDYETILNYGTAGRGAFAGVRARF